MPKKKETTVVDNKSDNDETVIQESTENAKITEDSKQVTEDDADVTTEAELSELDENSDNSKEGTSDTKVDSADDSAEEYVMSNQFISLFEGAIYRRTVLTGELTGVERTRLGVVAKVSYNGNTEGLRYDSATVMIQADNMGLDENAIRSHIMNRANKAGIKLSDESYAQQKLNLQYRLINNMLGAKIDFIPTELLSDSKIVIGDRVAAMNRKKRDFRPTRNNPIPLIGVGDRQLARVLRVNSRFLVVEVSGYEVLMSPYQITPMAIDIPEQFSVGDSLPVIITKVTEEGISVVGSEANRVDVKRKVREYKYNEQVVGKIYFHNPRTGKFYIKMPNGCRGVAYHDKSVVYHNPKVGDRVRVKITGYTPSGDTVKCKINSVI